MRVERETEPREASAEFGRCGYGGEQPEAEEMTWTVEAAGIFDRNSKYGNSKPYCNVRYEWWFWNINTFIKS